MMMMGNEKVESRVIDGWATLTHHPNTSDVSSRLICLARLSSCTFGCRGQCRCACAYCRDQGKQLHSRRLPDLSCLRHDRSKVLRAAAVRADVVIAAENMAGRGAYMIPTGGRSRYTRTR